MSLSPTPFLRLGIATLALSVALAVWTGYDTPVASWWRLAAGAFAFCVVTGTGEVAVRRIAAMAAIGTRGRGRD